MVPVICLTNGRADCLTRTLAAARAHLHGTGELVILNDSPDPAYATWLDTTIAGRDTRVEHLPAPHGYWRAMQAVWHLARSVDSPVFFLEDDFVLREPVDIADLAGLLEDRPHLTQVALLRQPWFRNEIEHGGLIEALEAQGHTFAECTDGRRWWIEHRAVFTGNPSLIPQRTFAHDWPEGAWSESRFARDLFADPDARAAYWGRRSDAPRVEHIGRERVGTDY
ncbi:MAG: hypothetical protein IRZ07_26020 [Microbispora sp.]|nr:hypothetical protein [Microbispora sp.]